MLGVFNVGGEGGGGGSNGTARIVRFVDFGKEVEGWGAGFGIEEKG